jgi:hypothetical protein
MKVVPAPGVLSAAQFGVKICLGIGKDFKDLHGTPDSHPSIASLQPFSTRMPSLSSRTGAGCSTCGSSGGTGSSLST